MSTKLIDPATDAFSRIGRYDLVAEIAAGGMATVYLGRLSGVGGFQRNVAIKCLHPHLARNLEFVEMFLDEARLAALIHHTNVVGILEVQESDQGYYLVMDYVEGDTFASMLSRTASSGQQVPWDVALRILIDTLNGLHAAHEQRDDSGMVIGLVHRDVSPQNILVGTDGVSRITDFGVARAATRLSATRAGQLKGKLAYMAPEQAAGEEAVDRRADVFSAAVVLWEALAFRRLFKASNEAATLTRVLTETIVSPRSVNPAVPEPISRVCMKGLERDLSQRYATCAEFADALAAAAVEAASPIASARDVAAFVVQVVGDDVESQRRAIRHWLDRRERNQSGFAGVTREPSRVSGLPRRPSDISSLAGMAHERSRTGPPPPPLRSSAIGRLPPPGMALGSERPHAEPLQEFQSAWPSTLISPSQPPPLRRVGLDSRVAPLPSSSEDFLPPSFFPPSLPLRPSSVGGQGTFQASGLPSGGSMPPLGLGGAPGQLQPAFSTRTPSYTQASGQIAPGPLGVVSNVPAPWGGLVALTQAQTHVGASAQSLTDFTASVLPNIGSPTAMDDSVPEDPWGKRARLRQRGVLGLMVASVFALSFCVMWWLTGDKGTERKSPLPIRSNASGSGQAEVSASPPPRSLPLNSPGEHPERAAAPVVASPPPPVVQAPAKVEAAAAQPAIEKAPAEKPAEKPVTNAAPSERSAQNAARVSGALRGERSSAPSRRRSEAQETAKPARASKSRRAGSEPDLENPYQ